MLQRRRLNTVQLVLVSILVCSSVYLWNKRIHPFRYDDSAFVYKPEDAKENEIAFAGSAEEPSDSNPPAVPLADPSDSEAVEAVSDQEASVPLQEAPVPRQEAPVSLQEAAPQQCSQEATESADLGVEPFPQFNFDLSGEVENNRTLDWLDLWNDDANCTQYQVRLLPDDTVPDPGALVSFPGSGNTWLRMLLMGATGIFIRSVYDGDDSRFQSKGECRAILNQCPEGRFLWCRAT